MMDANATAWSEAQEKTLHPIWEPFGGCLGSWSTKEDCTDLRVGTLQFILRLIPSLPPITQAMPHEHLLSASGLSPLHPSSYFKFVSFYDALDRIPAEFKPLTGDLLQRHLQEQTLWQWRGKAQRLMELQQSSAETRKGWPKGLATLVRGIDKGLISTIANARLHHLPTMRFNTEGTDFLVEKDRTFRSLTHEEQQQVEVNASGRAQGFAYALGHPFYPSS